MRKQIALWTVLGVGALFAQAQSPEAGIRSVLQQQAADWNRGDIRAFMRGYADSPDTVFVGNQISRGYEAVLQRYLAKYTTPGKMGKLTFSDMEVHPIGVDYAWVVGRFALARTKADGGPASGVYSLLFHRTPQGWKIILDHTS